MQSKSPCIANTLNESPYLPALCVVPVTVTVSPVVLNLSTESKEVGSSGDE